MLLTDLVDTSAVVSATRSRLAKTAAVAELLAAAEVTELEVVVSYLSGSLTQRRTGLGWKGVVDLPPPSVEPELEVAEVDAVFEEISTVSGTGSQARRRALVDDLFGRATTQEQRLLRGLVTGELRQGAQEGTVVEAIAKASDVPAASVRRAVMLGGSLGPVAVAARTGGVEALEEFSLKLMRPVRPMLAASAATVEEAAANHPGEDQVWDTKLDGIRIQVHLDRAADQHVRIWTRSLDEITSRLPEVVELVLSLPAERLVVDGEAIALDDGGRPRPFQETASRTATRSPASAEEVPVTAFFYDILHADGRDLLDEPLATRLTELDRVVPEDSRTRRLVTADSGAAQDFFDDLVARGHEGVIVKRPESAYEAGRRGSGWVKVKPVHTLDLVVIAVEWGSGRRRGKLSNLHLAVRDADSPTGLTMVGKTFKGMTDEMLAWQTERFLALETGRDGHVVHVRPEQVVEIAYDGVQTSTRYPGGVALRFARVLRYRDDKTPEQADVLDALAAGL
ncbi:ATP-dependent DNA ligase [Nocardioidaceae bacterium]|nr:ATP-dependent DNA ligase [Nocardioidaceae bacterium]